MGGGANFEHEPSYVIAGFFVMFLAISIGVEHWLHHMKHTLEHHHRQGLLEALRKMQDEMMLLGLLSFLLLCVEDNVLSVCAVGADHHWSVCGGYSVLFDGTASYYSDANECHRRRRLLGEAPSDECKELEADCHRRHLLGAADDDETVANCTVDEDRCADRRRFRRRGLLGKVRSLLGAEEDADADAAYCQALDECHTERLADPSVVCDDDDSHLRHLLSSEGGGRRHLLGAGEPDKTVCQVQGYPAGYEPVVGQAALHETHVFIFIMAVVHILTAVGVMTMATFCVRHWEERQERYLLEQLMEKRKNLKRQLTSQQMENSSAYRFEKSMQSRVEKLDKEMTVFSHAALVFRKVMSPLTTEKLITAQKYFIENRNVRNTTTFQFAAYVLRCVDDDFTQIVGISLTMWICATVYVLIQGPWAEGALLITTLVNFLLTVAMSLKLRNIVHKVCEAQEKNIWLGDSIFWFKKPKMMLSILRMNIFQTSFQLSTMLFYAWQFPASTNGCMWNKMAPWAAYFSLILCIFTFCETGMVLLPMYSLCVNLGESFNPSVFTDSTRKLVAKALRKTVKHFKTDVDAVIFIQRLWRSHCEKMYYRGIKQQIDGFEVQPPVVTGATPNKSDSA